MKQHSMADEDTVEANEVSFIKMKKYLLPKKASNGRKAKGVRI